MPGEAPSANQESAERRFRSRIFKPAEGVFLFHPRAMDRLIAEHLEAEGCDGAVPALSYYLMPCADFLLSLESENPEALAVVEGLSLPAQIILLPMPLELHSDERRMARVLQDYWARRFEGEVARAWRAKSEASEHGEPFGPERLRAQVGEIAFAEIREVLTRDGIAASGLDDTYLCRCFVAHVARLRFFAPGVRASLFPAVRDWAALDAWIASSGLDLRAPREGARLPELLERAKPEPDCRLPAHTQQLSMLAAYGHDDPDFDAGSTRRAALAPTWQTDGEARRLPPLAEIETPLPAARGAPVEARCLAALHQGLQLPKRAWRQRLKDLLLGLFSPLLRILLALPTRLRRRSAGVKAARGVRLELYLLLFSYSVRLAQRAELQGRYTKAVQRIARAERLFRAMGEPCAPEAEQVRRTLRQRRLGAEDSLSTLLAANWKLRPDEADELASLIARLGAHITSSDRVRSARALLRDFEKILVESRTTYYRLRLLGWIATLGRIRLRQILPFQAALKALRVLDGASTRLERLGWSIGDVERATTPLRLLSKRASAQLERQLKPHLHRALQEAGLTPRSHREEVAFNKLQRELLDVIQHRRHLKFTDMRDIVARNVLRLPDLTLKELLRGDRLSRFDRSAAKALPGIYKPGEIYIKGLQQLGAPLFGTPAGRLVLRHLLLPVAGAFLGLKTLDVLIALSTSGKPPIHLATPLLVLPIAVAINAIAYTRIGRVGARAFFKGLWWTLRLLLFDGLRRLVRWRPVSWVLDTALIRGLDRNLVRPFLVGTAMMLPVVGLASLVEGEWIVPNPSMLALTLVLGVLTRNTPAGRRVLDDLLSAVGRALRRLNQTLVLGLIQELMQFFKELTRRFQQGLHRIEEGLSHHLGESPLQLVLKTVLAPLWRLLESVIQFYVTVLVEPQINPIKHFPLVTVAHKIMLPFLPLITGFLVDVLEPVLPKWVALPFVTLTVLLLPGLAGFLVWELKENWKLYAANHAGITPSLGLGPARHAVRRSDLADAPLEPAIIGSHGETMRGFLRRGFHTGTLPKAFEKLRAALRAQSRDGGLLSKRLRDAQRHLAEVEQTICVFCDRELAYPLRRRCKDAACALIRIETRRPRLATASFELTLSLQARSDGDASTLDLSIVIWLEEPDVHFTATLADPQQHLGARCKALLREDIEVFAGRAGATVRSISMP